MQTIVVGYDGSDVAERALNRAIEVAKPLRAHVVVVAVESSALSPMGEPVAEPIGPSLIPVGPGGPLAPILPSGTERLPHREQEEPALRTLEHARGTLAKRHIDAEFVAAVGDPAESLLETADDHNADLIVVGSPEHGLLGRLLRSGVDDKVARRTHRDVLLVH